MGHYLELEKVSKIYRVGGAPVRALNGVSLTVDSGELLAIVGASGSGKSTLMHILGCLDVPSGGAYRLGGRAMEGLDDRALSRVRGREIGFIFQGFRLIPTLNALENVELPLLYQGVPAGRRRAVAAACLEQVGLGDRMRHRPSQLSGGQQQRVAIARAIAPRPGLILADEPTGNLDSRSGGQVVDLLLRLHAAGSTVIVITHDEALAARMPRRVKIRDGRIFSENT